MESISVTLADEGEARRVFYDALMLAVASIRADKPVALELKEVKRTTAQNSLMWSILSDLSRQVVWHGEKLTADDWKHMLSATIRKQRAVVGINGGFVVLGNRTSRMTKAEISEMIELAYALGAEHGVNWSRTSLGRHVPE